MRSTFVQLDDGTWIFEGPRHRLVFATREEARASMFALQDALEESTPVRLHTLVMYAENALAAQKHIDAQQHAAWVELFLAKLDQWKVENSSKSIDK